VLERPVYRDFELVLPQAPGLGIRLDTDKLDFYRRDRGTRPVAVTA
jgi:muconate cycloisomerase